MLRRLDFECERVCGDGTSHSPRRARASRAALVAGLVLQSGVLFSTLLFGQGSNTALVRGTVIDSSGAVVPNATVNMTNDGTKVVEKGNSDSAGRFIFNALKPASYTAQVEAQGFKTLIQEHIVLRVGQQIDLTFPLELGAVSQTLKIEAEAPLINTVSGALGTEVTNRYIVDMPLLDRSVINLAYLAPGVTEVAGSGIGSLGGTNFVSNGQRNGTAEFRLDGGLATTPEGGEGGNTFLSYLPSVEAIQEFKIQNNSFSAEYGNNGGTVVSIVTKSGTNSFMAVAGTSFAGPRSTPTTFSPTAIARRPATRPVPPTGARAPTRTTSTAPRWADQFISRKPSSSQTMSDRETIARSR